MLGDGEHINTRLPIIMKESAPRMHMLHRRKRAGITLRILSHKQRKVRNEKRKERGKREERREKGEGRREKGERRKRKKEKGKEEKGAALSTGRSPMPRNHPDPPKGLPKALPKALPKGLPKALVEWQRPAASASSRPRLPRAA